VQRRGFADAQPGKDQSGDQGAAAGGARCRRGVELGRGVEQRDDLLGALEVDRPGAPSLLLFDDLPEEPFVLVSVPLGHGLMAGAGDRARRIAHDLVRAARPYSEWRMARGAAVHLRGEEARWFGPGISARWDGGPTERFSPRFEPTGHGLNEIDEGLARAIVDGDESALAAVRDVEWEEAVAALPEAAQRLALGLRPIERSLPAPDGEGWVDAVTRYLKPWWVDDQSRRLIVDAAEGAVDVLEGMPVLGQESKWRGRLLPSSGDRFSINLAETLASTSELLSELEDGSMQRRVVAELAAVSDSPKSWIALLFEKERAFDALLARAARQRNAVVHGADTVPESLASVSRFVQWLESAVIHEQLSAAAAGETLPARLERVNLNLARRRARLAADEQVSQVLFGAPDQPRDSNGK
jgi:hypothetical protein